MGLASTPVKKSDSKILHDRKYDFLTWQDYCFFPEQDGKSMNTIFIIQSRVQRVPATSVTCRHCEKTSPD